ncbi:hypothetical protein [Lichenibacterium dinghuense]|uniref:hypothetical protein n=1 Tax=Lichenibacterium dinghuense TaxID=2895977 RepID=UPI001F387CFE|nr:hypothetical protein [Lichenibacterium sp. 6Y81]
MNNVVFMIARSGIMGLSPKPSIRPPASPDPPPVQRQKPPQLDEDSPDESPPPDDEEPPDESPPDGEGAEAAFMDAEVLAV